jgi:hypothetical protein
MFEEYGSIEGNFMADWQSKIRSTLKNLLNIIGRLSIADVLGESKKLMIC